MTIREKVKEHRDDILAMAAACGLSEPRLFGSVARGDERPGSDADFIVRRLPGTDPLNLLDFKMDLERLLGCRVDVLTEHPLMRPRLKKRIWRDLLPI